MHRTISIPSPMAFAVCVLAAASHCFASTTRCGNQDTLTSGPDTPNFSCDAWNADDSGFQCITLSDDYQVFEATWIWKAAAKMVHSYPHIDFDSDLLPAPVGNISRLMVQASWSMTAKNIGLKAANVMANVAIDIFADVDPVAAQDGVLASYEIMVWVGAVGSPRPLGYSNGPAQWTQFSGAIEFMLYIGTNHRGHKVFSWVAPYNIVDVDLDISPLLLALWKRRLIPSNVQLGVVNFGSEASHATENVSFYTTNFAMSIHFGNAPSFDNDSSDISFLSHSSIPISQNICCATVWAGIALMALLLV